jgi:predicted membrane channel-forming protein YqfA (hemolysin III family)
VEKTTLPFVGAGSMILGIALMVMPSTFITWMMYGLAAMLIIGAIGQFVSLVDAKKYATFSVLYWIMPTITLLVGIFIIVKPIESAALPFRIIGWAMMFYGVVETIQAIKIYRVKKEIEAQEVQGVQEEQGVQGVQEVQEEQEVKEEKEENAESTDNPLYILTDDTNSL